MNLIAFENGNTDEVKVVVDIIQNEFYWSVTV